VFSFLHLLEMTGGACLAIRGFPGSLFLEVFLQRLTLFLVLWDGLFLFQQDLLGATAAVERVSGFTQGNP
jgi:hypothetical protein